jgi:hypothetical protein
VKCRDYVNVPGSMGQAWDVKLGFVCRVHDRAVGIGNSNWTCGWTFVGDIGSDGAKMCSAAAISNRKRVRGGGPTYTVDRHKSEYLLVITLGRFVVVSVVSGVGSLRCQFGATAGSWRSRPDKMVLLPPFILKR